MSGPGTKAARSPLDTNAICRVRQMKRCNRECPAFILCPLMPLAVQPKDEKKRVCLVNLGDDRLKVAYYKMFVGGQNGVVQMLQTSILEYGEVLKKSKLTDLEHLRAIEKFNLMLERLHKMMAPAGKSGSGKKGGKSADNEDDEMDEVVLIASRNEPKPDPESLEHSPMLQDLITHDPIPANYVPQEKPKEIDLGKELLDKFFPVEE
jgi:hypothetical protein